MKPTEVFLSKSICLAEEMMRVGLGHLGIDGMMIQIDMSSELYGDEDQGSRQVRLQALVDVGREDFILANASSVVFCEDGKWVRGDISIEAPDKKGSFNCEVVAGQVIATPADSSES